MNTDIELPPLPHPIKYASAYRNFYTADQMRGYARACIAADRAKRGEPVGWIRGSGLQMLRDGHHACIYAHEGDSNHSTPVYLAAMPAQAERHAAELKKQADGIEMFKLSVTQNAIPRANAALLYRAEIAEADAAGVRAAVEIGKVYL